MKLIVGLGNPGKIYIDSRHNIGFSVVRNLAKIYKATLKRDGGTLSLSAKIKIGRESAILAVPFNFMNLSGVSIAALVKKYKIDLVNLLVLCDDLDLEFGRMKIKARGSSAGHRGLESIIEALGSRSFARLRIGIGRAPKNVDPAEYVLSVFTKKEKFFMEEITERAIDCCRFWVSEGIEKTMNIFNRRE